jgi:hypothetical protein
MNDSKKFQLNQSDVSALGKNALLIGAAASLTYAVENLDTLDLGTMGILFVPIVAVALETAIKWLKDNTK